MKDFALWSKAVDPYFSERRVVAFDLDDTLTLNGELPAQVHSQLEKAQAQGLTTILVTGRSAGWVDALIKLLPFDGVVGENGALLYYWPALKKNRKPREEAVKLYWTAQGYAVSPPKDIQSQHGRATSAILLKFPKARVASDQKYRIYDLAIDFAEEVDPPLSLKDAEAIRDLFEKLGAVAKVSSIHVNGWWGDFTKENGLKKLLEDIYGLSIEKNLVYVGDSPNDGPLFKVAGLSVGVANIQEFVGLSDFHLPQFVTQGKSSEGSVEVLEALLRIRSS